jgi:DNA transposition AAA+ family ATPase
LKIVGFLQITAYSITVLNYTVLIKSEEYSNKTTIMEDIPEKNDNELGIPTGMTDTAAVSVTIIEDSEVELVKKMSFEESTIFFASLAYIPHTYIIHI